MYFIRPVNAIILLPTNPFWQNIVLNSFAKHFNKARLFICNSPDLNNGEWIFSQSGEREKLIIEKLIAAKNQPHLTENLIDSNSHKRFLSKVALGLGFSIFGEKYLETNYSYFLRDILWRKELKNHPYPELFLGAFNPSVESIKTFLSWEGAHTFLIKEVGKYLVICICIYGTEFISVVISDEPNLWREHKNYMDGQIYLAVPQLNKALDPISFPEYINHKFGIELNSKLKEIEALKIDPNMLPPYH